MTKREREIAWAAGLFEGEGSIHVNSINTKRSTRRYLLLNLSSQDLDVVERFAAAMGCGKIYGPYNDKGARRPRWSWHAKNAADTAQALALLEPFLCERRTARLSELRALVASQPPPITRGWKLSDEHRKQISDRMVETWARRKRDARV